MTSAGPLLSLVMPITFAIPAGVATGAPLRLKQGLPVIGRQVPMVVPAEFSNGKGAPAALLTVTGHEPAQLDSVPGSKHANLSLTVPTACTITSEPMVAIG